jgi:ribosome-binding ATPase YchF (GTP1/OBG family)
MDKDQLKILEIALDCINNNKNLKILNEQFNNKVLNQSGLLSIKPKIYVCNVDEKSVQNGNKYTEDFINKFGDKNTLIISAEIENQINQLENDEKVNYMKMIGLKETGLSMLIQKGYNVLELKTFFTSELEETRAWTIQKNCSAQKAAGEIHTDFEKGFIKAETIAYDDFIKNQGWVNSRTKGKMRLEGKDYIVKDGDILNFRFNT